MTPLGSVAAPSDSRLYQLFVLLHVICVVGGFGAIVYRSFVLDLARRRGFAAAAGVLAVFGQVVQVGEFLLYGAGVFGIAAAATGGSGTSFSRPWVSAALAVFVVMVGVLHGLVGPAERRYKAALLELAQAPAMAPPGRPPQLAEFDRLYRRIGAGMGIFNLLLLGVLYLMVFKP
jgi:hypothetical protein